MIKEVCTRLRDKRKELGLTLEEVVEDTKLHPSVIRDIEGGNLAGLNEIYLRGFIKIYAAFLNIDIGSALDEIGALPSTPSAQTYFSPSKTKREAGILINDTLPLWGMHDKVKSLWPQIKRIMVFIVIAGLFVWAAVRLTGFIGSKLPKFEPKAEQPSAVVSDAPVKPAPVERSSGEMVVSVTVKRNCYLRVKVDGMLLFEGVLAKGAVETWKGKKEIELSIKDGSAVYLEVNGKALPPLTSMRKSIKSVKITPSGISVDK